MRRITSRGIETRCEPCHHRTAELPDWGDIHDRNERRREVCFLAASWLSVYCCWSVLLFRLRRRRNNRSGRSGRHRCRLARGVGTPIEIQKDGPNNLSNQGQQQQTDISIGACFRPRRGGILGSRSGHCSTSLSSLCQCTRTRYAFQSSSRLTRTEDTAGDAVADLHLVGHTAHWLAYRFGRAHVDDSDRAEILRLVGDG